MTILIAFFLMSIIFSFLCSIWEAVLLSVTPSFVRRKQQEDPVVGKLLAGFKKDIDRPLSAILTLNTIAHTVGAIGVGAQAGEMFGDNGFKVLGIALSFESIIATGMTLSILFLSEIIPKTIGANNWRNLAGFTARSLKLLVTVLKPFVWVSNLITKTLKKDKNKSVFSKRDFAAMADMIGESGGIVEDDYRLIKNVLQFDELKARDVMTPRMVMIMAEETQTLREFYDSNKWTVFSRIPLYRTNKDSVTGVLLKDDMLQALVDGKGDIQLHEIRRDMPILPEGAPLRVVFQELNEKREHLAVVVDEYGGLEGLVTLEDVIETLFGLEIMDEKDTIGDLRQHARKIWEERAKKLGLIE
jgi:CBS domain containing-hemolysin-like protein